MSRLEVDTKSIQKIIKKRAAKAQKTLSQFEGKAEKLMKQLVKQGLKSQKEGKKQFEKIVKDVRKTVSKSPWFKTLKKSQVYSTALEAKDLLEKQASVYQEKVFEVLNVPTKKELDKLNRKIDVLNRQLSGTRKNKTSSSAAA